MSSAVLLVLSAGSVLPAQEVQAVTFSSCADANAAGYYNIRRGEDGYSSRLDRDNDGIACEAAGGGSSSGSSSGSTSGSVATVSYSVVPVANGWDYSVWSDYQGGTRLGSLNDIAYEILPVSKEVTVNGTRMVYFQTGRLSGWVAKAGVIEGAYESGSKMTPVARAGDYGIWTHFRGGSFVANLSAYSGRTLTVKHTVNGWGMIQENGRDLGWVSLQGLTRVGEVVSVSYNAIPVVNGWDYSVWTNAQNGSRVGSLNDVRNQVLYVSQETVVNGTPMVYFTSPTISGWAAKAAIHAGGMNIQETGIPVANAWDYGIWSHFQGGSRLDSLNSYQNQELTAVVEAHGWVLIKSGSQTVGWVAKAGLQLGKAPFTAYTAVSVDNGWDYGVWSAPTNGQRLGSLNDFRGELLTVVAENSDGSWVQFSSPNQGTVGWAAVQGLVPRDYEFVPYSAVPVANAWDYSVWSDVVNGRRLGSLNDYANQEVTVVADSADGSMVQFKIGERVIGWVSVLALQ